MGAVVAALGTMAAIGVVGWLLGRRQLLGPDAEQVLARAVFTIAVPCLLLVTIAEADLRLLVSRTALATAVCTSVVVAVAAGVCAGLWRRPLAEATVVTLSASYVNAGNLGLPLAVYLLGDPVAVVPTLLFQLLVLAPVAFTVLESGAGADAVVTGSAGRGRAGRTVTRTASNPIIIGTLVGLLLAGLPWTVPGILLEPFRLIGAAAAPLALITFGMSLAVPRPSGQRRLTNDLVLVVLLRSAVHPILAAGVGSLLGLTGPSLLAVVMMASLPTAQNVLVYALRYGTSATVARDAGLVTTALSAPVMLAVAALLA